MTLPHPRPLQIAPEVADALAAGRPVVALESTVISHGLPAPHNLDLARRMEATVRSGGAVPATIAVIEGRLRVGLDEAALARLAGGGAAIAKASLRDLGRLVAGRGDAATTVAATMQIAALAGVRVFATGGIGGVHRGAGENFDVSADLQALARFPVAVVCAGPKAVLDIAATLEVLETGGVPVWGLGCEEVPAFYTRRSGHPADARFDRPQDVAAALAAHWALDGAGALLVQPVPEDHALPQGLAEAAIRVALDDAAREGIHGKAVTPFLLARMATLTEGRSVDANIALLVANAQAATAIAGALAGLPGPTGVGVEEPAHVAN